MYRRMDEFVRDWGFNPCMKWLTSNEVQKTADGVDM